MTPATRLLAVVVTVAVLAVTGVSQPVSGAAPTANESSVGVSAPDAPCAGVSETRLVGYLPTNERVESDRSLYAGSEIELFLCQSGDTEPTTTWSITGADGFKIETEGESSVTVVVTAADGAVSLADHVETDYSLSGAPSFTPVSAYRATSELGDESRTLTFPSAESRSAFVSNETAFQNELRELETVREEINSTNATVDGSLGALPEDELERINGSIGPSGKLATTASELNRSAFAAVDAGDGGDASAVIEAAGQRQATARSETVAALRAYRERLSDVRRDATRTVRLMFVLPLLGLALVGAGGGYALGRRVLAGVEYDQQVSAREFSLADVKLPLGIGTALLLVGVGALAVLGRAFLGVIA
ncbi:MAG: hypothetical protein ABEJ79_06480 [Halolamina sp.]